MADADEVVLPDVQSESQASTQPSTQPSTQFSEQEDEPIAVDTQETDVSAAHQTKESFHPAQEGVRSRGATVEPINKDSPPTEEGRTGEIALESKETDPEVNSSPVRKPKVDVGQKEPQPISNLESSPAKTQIPKAPSIETGGPQSEDEVMKDVPEDPTNDDTVLDNLDDIGSPSDGSTPERLPVRKSSLSFASLPAREPLKSLGGPRLSRTSHIELTKINNARASHFGRQTGGHRMTQTAAEDNSNSGAMAIDHDKESNEEEEPDQATKMHSKKSTQTLHERISMLGKLQPVSRPRKSIPSSGAHAGQISYPELPASKPEASSHKAPEAPVFETNSPGADWIKPLSSPQRPEPPKSETTDIMNKPSGPEKERAAGKKDTPNAESERPKSSTSIFSSPRPHGHQQSASFSHISAVASTTPTGSPRRPDGPISASKLRLHSIMKSAKGLFSSTGSTPKIELSSPEQSRVQPRAESPSKIVEYPPQSNQPSSPSREDGRRTRSSTEKEEKRRQHKLQEKQREEEEEARNEKSRQQEKQKANQLKAAQSKPSVEPEDKAEPTTHKNPQSLRQPSREPESSRDAGSRYANSQPKQNDRRPLKPTREAVQKPTPQPMSIRVGSTLSRQIPMPSSAVGPDSSMSAAAPATASKPTLKKKGSNTSLHTSSSASSFKSSVSSQTQAAQRKAQVTSKKEQEERRKEEQRREAERKRVAQQEEARRQGMRSRAESRAESRVEADRERRERSAQEDPKRAAQMDAIRRRQQENARGHGRQGSQQISKEVSAFLSWYLFHSFNMSRAPCFNTRSHLHSRLNEVTWALPALRHVWVALSSHMAASTHLRPILSNQLRGP